MHGKARVHQFFWSQFSEFGTWSRKIFRIPIFMAAHNIFEEVELEKIEWRKQKSNSRV